VEHDADYFEHQLLRLLEDAVRLQLRADVPVGAYLSGGLDSSVVTCLASSLLDQRLRTFTGAFRTAPEFDETGYARTVADHARTCHQEVFPTEEDFVSLLPLITYHMDEPAAGPGSFPQYCVSRAARQQVKVVLGGQGGDEIFGGYTRYLLAYLEQCIKGGIEGTYEDQRYVVTFESIIDNLREIQGYQPLLQSFWKEGLFESEDRRYCRLIDRSAGTAGLISPDYLTSESEYNWYGEFRELFFSARCRSLINKMTWFDMRTLLPALLHVEDRVSMAVSLESRVPLLDHRIVELVASMPPMIKYKGGRSKHIFRAVARNIVPQQILARQDKMGFPVPLNHWYKHGVVRDFARDILTGTRARQRGFLDTNRVASLLDEERAYGRTVWGLVSLELWMQTFLDAPSDV
jgi:asparagine synthase (glutamine-hydrolysing)